MAKRKTKIDAKELTEIKKIADLLSSKLAKLIHEDDYTDQDPMLEPQEEEDKTFDREEFIKDLDGITRYCVENGHMTVDEVRAAKREG